MESITSLFRPGVLTWTPTTTGSYPLSVTAQDGITGTEVNALLWDTISGPPLTGVTATPSPASPQQVNSPVTITATATGGTSVQYQFWLYNPSANPAWSQLQAYSAQASCPGTPVLPGPYLISVTAQDGISGTEVNTLFWDTVTATVPLSALGINATPVSPQEVGTPVTIASNVTGGSNVIYQYWLYAPNATPAWSMLQDFSPLTTCSWTPTEPEIICSMSPRMIFPPARK